MTKRRARIYDALALLVVIIIIVLDQWTKSLVVEHLSPPDTGPVIHLIGQYLLLFYIQNNGAAFSLFSNSIVLVGLIIVAVGVISYMYARMVNSGSLAIKLIFGMIVGGALGNIIDRARHAGYVVDFIAFRIPQINFYFAIFNLADAAISVGVFLLFVTLLFSGFRRPHTASDPQTSTENSDDSLRNHQKGTP
ncbi:MAG TPA: signal peptidase II [Ktedonobacteraceae bacterium]|nr:signal peptidase II [Ktedonobacteraceae bacterium]